jgi:hypothetical protein
VLKLTRLAQHVSKTYLSEKNPAMNVLSCVGEEDDIEKRGTLNVDVLNWIGLDTLRQFPREDTRFGATEGWH